MVINRIEVAIECDDPMGEGIEALGTIVSGLGLDPEKDVEAIVTASEDGEPVLLAVLEVADADEEETHDH